MLFRSVTTFEGFVESLDRGDYSVMIAEVRDSGTFFRDSETARFWEGRLSGFGGAGRSAGVRSRLSRAQAKTLMKGIKKVMAHEHRGGDIPGSISSVDAHSIFTVHGDMMVGTTGSRVKKTVTRTDRDDANLPSHEKGPWRRAKVLGAILAACSSVAGIATLALRVFQ